MNENKLTRLALLGTMSELHREPLAYDLACLAAIVADLAPDLLCAEITREMWEGGDLSDAALEVREALAPVVAATDVVLVPVAQTPERFGDFGPGSGWGTTLGLTFDRVLQWSQRQAQTPQSVNGPLYGAFCHAICYLKERSWNAQQREAWQAQNEAMAANVVGTVRRDPGRRVLLAVQCQRIHKLQPLLKAYAGDVQLVPYQSL